jgi:hypothetical protein
MNIAQKSLLFESLRNRVQGKIVSSAGGSNPRPSTLLLVDDDFQFFYIRRDFESNITHKQDNLEIRGLQKQNFTLMEMQNITEQNRKINLLNKQTNKQTNITDIRIM